MMNDVSEMNVENGGQVATSDLALPAMPPVEPIYSTPDGKVLWKFLYGSQPRYSRWVNFVHWVVERYSLTDKVLDYLLLGNPFFPVADDKVGWEEVRYGQWAPKARALFRSLHQEEDCTDLWKDLLTETTAASHAILMAVVRRILWLEQLLALLVIL